MLKQSFYYPLFLRAEMSLDTLCREAAGLGYQGVETWWAHDEAFPRLVDAAKAHGLTIASLCGHQSLTMGMNRRQEHARILAELRQSLDVAHRLGIPNLICFSGDRHDGQSDREGLEACAACLARIADDAAAAGVTLNIELLNSKVERPAYQCDHISWAVELCRRLNHPRVKLLFDIYHVQIMDGDIIRNLRDNIGYIGHFHTAGNPGRRDLDQEQELNYPAICRAIAATGYTGFVAHEFTPKADPIEALRAAFAACEGR